MKVIISSDWHGDAITDGVPRFAEISRATDEIVTLARRYAMSEPVLFIFGGDLTDPHTPRSHATVALAVDVANRLEANGRIHSLWLTGNHDTMEDGSGEHTLMALRNTGAGSRRVVADRPMVTHYDVGNAARDQLCVASLPFVASSHAYNPGEFVMGLDVIPDLVVGHLNLAGIDTGSESTEFARGRDIFWPIEELDRKCPNAVRIGGHYHLRQRFADVQIIGTLAQLTHGESENVPGFLVLDIS